MLIVAQMNPPARPPTSAERKRTRRVRHEFVDEREYAGNEEIGRQLACCDEQRPKEFLMQQVLHDRIAAQRGDHAERDDDDHRTDQQNDGVFGETTRKAAPLADVPDVIEALLDPLHHGDREIDHEGQADATEHAAPHVTHESHDLVLDLHALVAERREQRAELWLELIEQTQALEYGETEGDQRHDRE